jgi:molybdate transport system regulatory protein
MGRSSPRSIPAYRLSCRAKVWLELDGRYVFGLGISEILKAVDRTGSIKAAAQELDKSYRYVWAKLKETEQALGVPLVRARVGGKGVRRSELTSLAQDLVAEFDALREDVFETVESTFRNRVQTTLAGAIRRTACDPLVPRPASG